MSEAPVVISVNGADFARAVAAVEKSAAKDDSRPVLAGILIEVEGCEMTLVAADGFRLAYASLPCDTGEEMAGRAKFILRREPLVNFAKRAKRTPVVTIKRDAGGMWVLKDTKLKESAVIPAIDGTFPDWRGKIVADVVGDNPETIATYNAKYLAEAAATAPPDAMLRIQRKAGKKAVQNPAMLEIAELDGTMICTHIIMPLVRSDGEAS